MKRTLSQLISGVAIACVFPLLLGGCIVESGGKIRTACADISDCDANEICNSSGFCQVVSVQPQTCESDADCGVTQRCNDQKLCQDMALCYSDAECGSNQACNLEDYCFAPPGDPYLTVCLGLCEDKGPGVDCWHDSDCGADEYCELQSFNNPEDPSQMPAVMPQGYCQPKPAEFCHSHSDCSEGRYCAPEWDVHYGGDDSEQPGMMPVGGACKDLVHDQCITSNDCPSDAICMIDQQWGPGYPGTCVSETIHCWAHVECGEGSYCAPELVGHEQSDVPADQAGMEPPMGVCTELLAGQCVSNSDCGKAGVCEHPNPDMGPGTCAVVIATCTSDAECDWNQDCEFPGGVEPHGEKPGTGICVTQEPVHCSDDWECDDGEYCEFDDAIWSQFGCAEHPSSEAPMVNQGICIPKDIAFE